MKKIIICMFLLTTMITYAQNNESYLKTSWKNLSEKGSDEFFSSQQAVSIAENVLLYQRNTGGWPKNVEMHYPLTSEQKAQIMKDKLRIDDSTTDNNATICELTFLAKLYKQHKNEKYKQAFDKGLEYLFEAQYPSGGWPQFYPLKKGYYSHITYNDNSMVRIMNFLQDIHLEKEPFAEIVSEEMKQKAGQSYDKGIECILKTQIKINGQPTVWCAQHDTLTFLPAKARAYELPSFSGAESVNIVKLLMDIKNPSPEVIASVEGTVKWFEEHAIKETKVVFFIDQNGKKDRRIERDPNAPLIWARFYDLETGKPFFCDRDGIKRENLSEVGQERRGGYSWFTSSPQDIIKKYPQWKAKLSK